MLIPLLTEAGFEFAGNLFKNAIYADFINNIFFVLIILMLMMVLRKQNFNITEIFSIEKINYKVIILSILIGAVVCFIDIYLNHSIRILLNPNLVASVSKNALKINLNTFFYISSIVIFAPLCEEFLYRGYILNAFKKFGFFQAIVFTSFLFSLRHPPIYHAISAGFMGLIFGYLVYRTGSIFSGVLAHAANNMIIILFNNFYLCKFDIHTQLYISVILVIPAAISMIILIKMLIKETSDIEVDKIRFEGAWNNIRSLFGYWQFWIVILIFLFNLTQLF